MLLPQSPTGINRSPREHRCKRAINTLSTPSPDSTMMGHPLVIALGGLACLRLGLAAQLPLQLPTMSTPPAAKGNETARRVRPPFELKHGPDVFTPADMLELPRPGTGVPNAAGDLFLVAASKYSFTDKK